MPSKPWRERVRHFTPAWWTVIMGTGAVALLFHAFPYGGPNHPALRGLFMAFYMLNFVLMLLVLGMTIARYVMFPETWRLMLYHPAQSMFLGAFPMGMATLINCSLVANQEWGWGGPGFLYTLWAFWWADALVSFVCAFGMIYVMMVRHDHAISKMTGVWLLPIVSLIVASSTGAIVSAPMVGYHQTLAVLSAGFSFLMVIIGLSLAIMIITIYFLRLVIHGPPDISLILSALVILGPLGQGGFSLLANGANISFLLPVGVRSDNFPHTAITGEILYGITFCGAYILWSMGFCWAIIALLSIGNQLRHGRIPFSLAYWGTIFPNGVYALLSCQLAKVTDSPFFRGFGAFWCALTFFLWFAVMVPTIPAVIDGSIFKAPCLANVQAPGLSVPCTQAEKTQGQTQGIQSETSSQTAGDKRV